MGLPSLSEIFVLVTHVGYPNWVSVAYFTQGWDFFFNQEKYIIGVLYTIALICQHFLHGISLGGMLLDFSLIVAGRRFFSGGICTSKVRLDGKTVIVTGANGGIGLETARDMLQRGARVILACRNRSRGEDARRALLGEGGKVEFRQLDLSSLRSVRDFAAGIVKENIQIHILINNAAVMMTPYEETEDGFEMQMGTNHLGHFLLTNLLLPQMKHGQPARIINVSSIGHLGAKLDFNDFFAKENYDKLLSYSNSKLANILFSTQLAKNLKGSKIQVFSLHPGSVYSSLTRHVLATPLNDYVARLMQKTPMEGAQTTIYCATEAKQSDEMYFTDCCVDWPLDAAKDPKMADKLWKVSADLVKLN